MHPVKFLSRGRGGGLWWPAGLLLCDNGYILYLAYTVDFIMTITHIFRSHISKKAQFLGLLRHVIRNVITGHIFNI